MTEKRAKPVLPTLGTHPWQLRAALSMGVLYLFFYFCKYNFGVATPGMQAEYGLNNQDIGYVVTVFTLVYAAGQFINGYLGDRFGPKLIVIIGGFGGVVANLLFAATPWFSSGSATILNVMIGVWAINAYFSSMGWSPGCRIMFNWFPERRWGQWIGIYNALCYAGGAIVLPVAGFAAERWGWEAAFIVPPIFLLLMTVAFFFLGRNSPADAGFDTEWAPAKQEKKQAVTASDYWRALIHPRMNLAYLAGLGGNFIRWGLMSWMYKILSEPIADGGFGLSGSVAGWVASLMHWGGAFFSITLGVVSDRVFRGKRWQTVLISHATCAVALVGIATGPSVPLLCVCLFLSGGLIQAVQTPLFALSGDILSKRLGSTGAGIMDGWMYVGASLAGVGLGFVLDTQGISTGVLIMAAVAAVCGCAMIPLKH